MIRGGHLTRHFVLRSIQVLMLPTSDRSKHLDNEADTEKSSTIATPEVFEQSEERAEIRIKF